MLIAAFLPSLYPVWTARAVNAVGIIAQHRGTWRLANVLFAAGAGLTLAGLAALTGRLNARPAATGILPTVALTLMALASALWLANLAFRLTVTMRVAGAVANGGTVPDWYEDINAWTGGLWSIAALAGALATVCYGLAIRLARHRPRRPDAHPVPRHPRRPAVPAVPRADRVRRDRTHPGVAARGTQAATAEGPASTAVVGTGTWAGKRAAGSPRRTGPASRPAGRRPRPARDR